MLNEKNGIKTLLQRIRMFVKKIPFVNVKKRQKKQKEKKNIESTEKPSGKRVIVQKKKTRY